MNAHIPLIILVSSLDVLVLFADVTTRVSQQLKNQVVGFNNAVYRTTY